MSSLSHSFRRHTPHMKRLLIEMFVHSPQTVTRTLYRPASHAAQCGCRTLAPADISRLQTSEVIAAPCKSSRRVIRRTRPGGNQTSPSRQRTLKERVASARHRKGHLRLGSNEARRSSPAVRLVMRLHSSLDKLCAALVTECRRQSGEKMVMLDCSGMLTRKAASAQTAGGRMPSDHGRIHPWDGSASAASHKYLLVPPDGH